MMPQSFPSLIHDPRKFQGYFLSHQDPWTVSTTALKAPVQRFGSIWLARGKIRPQIFGRTWRTSIMYESQQRICLCFSNTLFDWLRGMIHVESLTWEISLFKILSHHSVALFIPIIATSSGVLLTTCLRTSLIWSAFWSCWQAYTTFGRSLRLASKMDHWEDPQGPARKKMRKGTKSCTECLYIS